MSDGCSQTPRVPGKVVAPEELVAILQSELALSQEAGSITALLMLELRRSDRLGALEVNPNRKSFSEDYLPGWVDC